MNLQWHAHFMNHKLTVETDEAEYNHELLSSYGHNTDLWCSKRTFPNGETRLFYFIGGTSLSARDIDTIETILSQSSHHITIRLHGSEGSVFMHIDKCSDLVPSGIEWSSENAAFIVDPLAVDSLLGQTNIMFTDGKHPGPFSIGFNTFDPHASIPDFFQKQIESATPISGGFSGGEDFSRNP